MPTIAEALRIAVDLHQRNRLAEAAELYQRILEADPSVADAWHLLGVLLHQTGQHGQATELIAAAIARDPGCAAYHDNLGSACRALGQAERAAACHRRAVALDPEAVKPLGNLGNALLDARRGGEAIIAFRRAVRLTPGQESLLLRLADALQSGGAAAEAVPLYRRLLAVQPGRPDLLYRLGIGTLALSRLPDSTLGTARGLVDVVLMRDAVACLDKAARGGHAEAWGNLFGTALLAIQNGILDDATLSLAALAGRRRLMAQPRDTAALSVVCYDLYRRKRLDLAERYYRKHARHATPEEVATDFELLLWMLVKGTDRFYAALGGYESRMFATAVRRTLTPPRDHDRPVVLVGCDDGYWRRFGGDFVASWRRHAGHCALHLHLINPSEDTAAALMDLAEAEGGRMSCSREDLDLGGVPETVRKTYFASARFAVARGLLRDGGPPVVQVDVDALFLKDPAAAMADWSAWDVAFLQDRRGRGPMRDVLAGFMAFNGTPAGRAFLDMVVAYIGWHFDQGQVYWMLDQAAPYGVQDWMRRSGSPLSAVWHDFESFPYFHFLPK
ncbi:tetratricopeptide repeat protein [Azospirillum sp. sgz302134]